MGIIDTVRKYVANKGKVETKLSETKGRSIYSPIVAENISTYDGWKNFIVESVAGISQSSKIENLTKELIGKFFNDEKQSDILNEIAKFISSNVDFKDKLLAEHNFPFCVGYNSKTGEFCLTGEHRSLNIIREQDGGYEMTSIKHEYEDKNNNNDIIVDVKHGKGNPIDFERIYKNDDESVILTRGNIMAVDFPAIDGSSGIISFTSNATSTKLEDSEVIDSKQDSFSIVYLKSNGKFEFESLNNEYNKDAKSVTVGDMLQKSMDAVYDSNKIPGEDKVFNNDEEFNQ